MGHPQRTKGLSQKRKKHQAIVRIQVDSALDFFMLSEPVSDEVVSAEFFLLFLEDGFGVLADLLA